MRSVRLVSFAQRSVAAIRYEVEPLDGETRIVAAVRAGRQRGRCPAQSADPRAAALLRRAARGGVHGIHELRAALVHRTRASGLRMAAAMDHVVDGPRAR